MPLENLRKRRNELGMSLQEVADLCGTTKQNMHGYEMGAHQCPASMLKILAMVLSCSADYLLGITNCKE
jgi:transcriptional regulator with XRE-family HTH domain